MTAMTSPPTGLEPPGRGRPEPAAGPDGFGQLLRAEWTKFRTVRGWVIGTIVGALLIVGLGVLTTSNSVYSIQQGPTSSG